MAKRRRSFRRAGVNVKSLVKLGVMGLGLSSILPSPVNAVAGYALGGIQGAAITFFAPQIGGMVSNISGSLGGLMGGSTGNGGAP